MAGYKVTDLEDGTIKVGCGCRGKKDVIIDVEHVARMAEENHDIDKAAAAVGIPGGRASQRQAMRAVMRWAVDTGVVDEPAAGWLS